MDDVGQEFLRCPVTQQSDLTRRAITKGSLVFEDKVIDASWRRHWWEPLHILIHGDLASWVDVEAEKYPASMTQ